MKRSILCFFYLLFVPYDRDLCVFVRLFVLLFVKKKKKTKKTSPQRLPRRKSPPRCFCVPFVKIPTFRCTRKIHCNRIGQPHVYVFFYVPFKNVFFKCVRYFSASTNAFPSVVSVRFSGRHYVSITIYITYTVCKTNKVN